MKSLNHSLNHFCKDLKRICKKKMTGPDFKFDGINFFYYNFNKANIYKGGSYIDSWILG